MNAYAITMRVVVKADTIEEAEEIRERLAEAAMDATPWFTVNTQTPVPTITGSAPASELTS